MNAETQEMSAIQSRKGQGLSISTLMLVALGILVLVLSIAIYDRIWNDADDTISDCRNQGGICLDECEQPTPFENRIASCPDEDDSCCMGRGS